MISYDWIEDISYIPFFSNLILCFTRFLIWGNDCMFFCTSKLVLMHFWFKTPLFLKLEGLWKNRKPNSDTQASRWHRGVFPWLELLTQFSFEKQPIFGTVSKIALFKLKTKHTSYWTHLARRWWSWWSFKSMDILHSPFEYCPANLDGGSLLLLKIGQNPNLSIWKLLKCP